MPQRAPMAWPNRRRAHCHLPPRALPGAQPRQHDAQCAEQHHKQLGTPPTFLITKHQSCAPRGRVRRTNASRFAHASSRLRIAPHHPTCSSFYSTHRSPAYAACCTALCKRHAREPSRGPGQCIWKQDGAQNHAPRTLFPDCESPRTIPHALPFTPLIAHQLVQLVAQHFASDVHESPRAAQPISKQDGVRSRSARAAIACARRQRRSQARRAPMCEYLSAYVCALPEGRPFLGRRVPSRL